MDTLYKEGVQLTHQRKYELARAKFVEAIALDGNDAEAVLSLSVVETDLGHPVAAYVTLRRYLRHPKADAATAAKARTRMAPALEAKVGQIAVTASPGVEVTVDGVSVGRAPLEETAVVLPGSHVVAAAGADAKTVEVGAGASVAVALVAGVEPAPAPMTPLVTDVHASGGPVVPAGEASGGVSRTSSVARLILPLAVGGAGLVAAGIGIGLLVVGGNKNDDAAASSAGRNCTGSQDPACVQALSLATTAQNDKNVGTGLIIGGSAAVVGAVATWLLWPSSQQQAAARVVPNVGPGNAGLSVVGSF